MRDRTRLVLIIGVIVMLAELVAAAKLTQWSEIEQALQVKRTSTLTEG